MAEPADQLALVSLMRDFSEEVMAPLSAAHIEAALTPLLNDPTIGDIWVAEEQGLIGYLVITWGWGIESGGREALIDEIFVDPAWRNMGIASALIEASLARAKGYQTKAVFLETEANNPESRELYKRLGFSEESSIWMSCLLEGND